MMELVLWQGSLRGQLLVYPDSIPWQFIPTVLSLCVVKCCSIREINNMMDVADRVARFF